MNPRVTLESFEMPDDHHVRPVLDNEERRTFVENDGNTVQHVSYLVNMSTGVHTPILPRNHDTLRMLTLGLDQGAVGCAGAAFLMFERHMMVK